MTTKPMRFDIFCVGNEFLARCNLRHGQRVPFFVDTTAANDKKILARHQRSFQHAATGTATLTMLLRAAFRSLVAQVYSTSPSPASLSRKINNQSSLQTIARMSSSSSSPPATADLCDQFVTSPSRLSVAEPGHFNDYGGISSFHGKIETLRIFESNPLVRKTLGEDGSGRVLVVDGGASRRVAILGDELATLAHQNNWAGLIMNGCIRDSAAIKTIPVGVKALGTHPLKSIKTHQGERACTVAFAGVEFVPGHWVYADEVSTVYCVVVGVSLCYTFACVL